MDSDNNQECLLFSFHKACSDNNLNKIIAHVQKGSPINSHANSIFGKEFEGYTPLHFAVYHKNEDAVIYLLEQGADITEKNSQCQTPVHLAFYKFSDYLVFRMFEYSQLSKMYFNTVDKIGLSHFHICCALNVPVIDQFIKYGVRLDCSISLLADYYYSGFTPLHFAIEKNHASIIKLLYEKYSNPNITCKGGLTPLHLACKVSQLSTIELLLSYGTDLKSKDNDGCTPLHIAVMEKRSVEIIQYLLKKGASIHDKNNANKTPLDIAAKNRQYEIVLAMASQGSNIQDVNLYDFFTLDDFLATCNDDNLHAMEMFTIFGFPINCHASDNFRPELQGYTPLHFAVKNQNLNAIIYLLEQGADIIEKADNKWTPIHLAYYSKGEALLPAIFEHSKVNTYIDIADGSGLTHFHICCRLSIPVIEEFIVSQVNINSQIKARNVVDSGFTPLHFAIQRGDISTIKLLLENGADHHLTNREGLTPLHLACKLSNACSVQILLDFGADVTARDNENRTPLHYAYDKASNTPIASLFLSRIPRTLIAETLGNDTINVVENNVVDFE